VTPSSLRIDAGLWALCTAAAAFAAVLMLPAMLIGGDLYWHIAAGRWMMENQQILRINLFSYTHAGDAWANQEWLAELIFAGAYVTTGWNAVLALAAAATAGGAGLLALFLARGRRAAVTAIWLGLAIVAGAGSVKALPFLLALPCMVAWIGVLAEAKAQPPLKLVPVMMVWANLSGSFVLGLVLVGAFAAEAILAAPNRLAVARAWAVFAGFALVASLITPTGVFGLAHALRVFATPAPIDSILPLIIALPAVAMLAPRQPVRAGLVAVLFLVAAMHAPARLLFAAAAPLLAAGARADEALRLAWRPLAALVVVVLAATGVRLVLPLQRGDDAFTPNSALDHVPATLRHQPVLNDRDFGGFLIFREIKPFIDGRPIYPPAFRRRASDPGLLAETLTRYHVRWTILKPAAAKAMDGRTGWHRLYADQWAVVHVKDDAH
jgi:hypothetical protein